MIINEELFQKRCRQGKAYLVYLLSDCEMGSEGFSGWIYYAVAHGSTDEKIYKGDTITLDGRKFVKVWGITHCKYGCPVLIECK